jgi:hypothetical protein
VLGGPEVVRGVNVNTTDATAGATALLLPAQNTHTLHDRCVSQQQQRDATCEGKGRCCSRGRRHRGARACALPRRLPRPTAALSVLSGYVRGEGHSFPRFPPINGLCNSRLCRPRLRPLR